MRKRSAPCILEAVEARLLFRTIFIDPNAPGPVGDGTSWDSAYTSLELARTSYINVNDEVRIADGLYKPTSTTNRAVSFSFPAGCVIKGGYAGYGAPDPNARNVSAYPSIFSGDIGITGDYSDNTYHVFSNNALATPVTLDGLTITGGNANQITTPQTDQNFGGGIAGSNLNVVNCVITGNRATNGGGGAVTSNSNSFSNCIFSNNTADNGAGLLVNIGTSTISGCSFTGNVATSSGGGLYATVPVVVTNATFSQNSANAGGGLATAANASLTLSAGTFTQNSAVTGGAVFVGNAAATLNRCKFNGNISSTEGGAIYNNSPTLKLFNTAFTSNSANRGGGVYNSSPYSALAVSCSFVSNIATSSGRAIQDANGTSILTNCIIWDPVPFKISPIAGSPSITYSDIKGAWNSTGVVNVDPLFMRNPAVGSDQHWGTADDDYGDLRLFPYSPLADAADNNALNSNAAGSTDLAGAARFRDIPTKANSGVGGGPTSDIGAYEAVPARVATTGGPYTGAQGQSIPLNALAASSVAGTLTFEWDFDADGQFDDAVGANTIFAIGMQPAGTILPIAVRVTDGGAVSYVATTTMTVAPAVIWVDSRATGANNGASWIDAYSSLADAFSHSVPFQEIRVATGTYKPTTSNDRTVSFKLLNGNIVKGGYAGLDATDPNTRDASAYPTILSGDIGMSGVNSDNSMHIVDASDTSETTRLDGVTITPGFADSRDTPLYYGNELLLINSALTVKNCVFSGQKVYGGGAVYVQGGAPSFLDCSFTQTRAFYQGAAVYAVNCSVNFANCVFNDNAGDGVIVTSNASSSFSQCSFIYSGSYAIEAFGNPNTNQLSLVNCVFQGNGYGCYLQIPTNLTGCTFIDNFGTQIYANSPVSAVNCNFVGMLDSGAPLLNVSGATGKLVNCIIWGNNIASGSVISGSSIDVTFSDIQGGYSGTGNINVDPMFRRNPSPGPDGNWRTADDDFGDLRLMANSPCIDAGNNIAVAPGISNDLGGNTRIIDIPGVRDPGAIVDMGAYEVQIPVYVTAGSLVLDGASPAIQLNFNVPIEGTSIAADDLIVRTVLGDGSFGEGITVTDFYYDATTRSIAFNLPTTMGDRNYRATLSAGKVSDSDGTATADNLNFDFFMLAGDANHDRQVDIRDLALLAASWQGSGKNFSHGDFNYDGLVDAKDLGILSARWSTSLLPPPAVQPAVLEKPAAKRAPARVAALVL